MIEFILSWKHGISIDQLSKNATDRPQIDFLPIRRTDKQLRRPIPSRGHIIGELFVAPLPDLPSKAEIANLQLLLITYQQVLRFDVAMQHVLAMHVRQSLEQLIQQKSDAFGVESIWRLLEHFEEVVLDVLKDEIDDALFAEGLLEFYNVGVL